MSEKPISPLRQRMLEDMNMRRFVPDTQREYIRAVKKTCGWRVSERMCKQVSVSLPYRGDSHDDQHDDYT